MRNFFLIAIFSFLISFSNLFPSKVFAADCSCSGNVVLYGNITQAQTWGIPFINLPQDGSIWDTNAHGTTAILDNTCLEEKPEVPIKSDADCMTYVGGKYYTPLMQNHGLTWKFDGKCQVVNCRQSDAQKALNKIEIKKPVLEILIPNLKFTEVSNIVDENGNIQFPWIGEYIKAVYRFGVSIASILGVIMIIVEGVRIVLSAGGEEKAAGYKHIGRVCVGLCLAWFSYVILFNINSDLVSFQALKVKLTSEISLGQEDDEVSNKAVTSDISIKKNSVNQTASFSNTTLARGPKPPWNSGEFTLEMCDKYQDKAFRADPGFPVYGSIPRSQTIGYRCPGIEGEEIRTVPQMQPALCKAGEIAVQMGYTLRIGTKDSSFRDFPGQVDTYCTNWHRTKVKPSSSAIATPGWSNHGRGIAVDISLLKNGKRVLAAGDTSTQCGTDEQYIRDLAQIMYTADPDNFFRLETEIWHFEYGLNGADWRVKTYTFPKKCNKPSRFPNA